MSLGALLVLGLSTVGFGYETDQLTDRTAPLADAGPVIDVLLYRRLVAVADAVNERTRCTASDNRTRRLAAKALFHELAGPARLNGRGFIRGFGYDQLTVAIETHPEIERRSFLPRDDIFGHARSGESFVLATAGPCSTIRIGDTLLGTDKISHIFHLGYGYWRKSRRGNNPERAIRYGTRTENSIYGLYTSNTFSWADLRANWDGYLLYRDLLLPNGPLARAEDGCLTPNHDLTLAGFIDWEYDEVLNPSRFGPNAQAAVTRALDANEDELCAEYATWGLPGYRLHRDEVLATRPFYAGAKAPERVDPFSLPERCAR